MKLENIPFAIIILILALVALCGIGWAVSFIFISVDASPEAAVSDIVVARITVGSAIVGMMLGFNKLVDLFIFCLRAPSAKELREKYR